MDLEDPSCQLPRYVDDSIAGMIYSMIGETSVEARLRYELDLAKKSLRDLHVQLQALQSRYQLLQEKHDKAREEATLNAAALKQKIGQCDALKETYEQLLKECELYRNDREIFAEAAEDAEERRAEADRRAAEAEERALEAEKREKAMVHFIEDVLKVSPVEVSQYTNQTEIPLSSEKKVRQTTHIITDSSNSSCAKNDLKRAHIVSETSQCHDVPVNRLTSLQGASVENGLVLSPLSGLLKEARGAKRVLFDACKAHEENSPVIRRRIGKGILVDRSRSTSENSKVARVQNVSPDEKENCKFLEAEAGVQIQEAAQSDNPALRHLAEMLIILKGNLLKAEAEGDLIHAKYCEIHKLLTDTLVTFGIVPELCPGKMAHPENSPEELKT